MSSEAPLPIEHASPPFDARRPLYLDYQATTPMDPRVLAAMLPYFSEHFGNAASRTHRYGVVAQKAVEKARAQVAHAIGAEGPSEIVFTSGATEANNLALIGLFEAYGEARKTLIVSAIEHPSLLETARYLEQNRGATLQILPVDAQGQVDADAATAAVSEHTLLLSVMAANNEVGTVQPLAELGAACRARGAFFHTDATQAVGKLPFQVDPMKIDLASLSAHKVYGPKGIGALYLRRRDPRVRPLPMLHGGGHERGFRSGTLPVPLIVAFGAALEIAEQEREEEAARLLKMRGRLLQDLQRELSGVVVHGSLEGRLPGNLTLSFEGLEAEPLILSMRELALSSGSACTSASAKPSHVLRAMGVDPALAHGSIRIGLGRFTQREELERATRIIIERVRALRHEG